MAAPVMCVECEDTEASLSCEECQDLYCDLCFQAQHRSGSRVKHTKTPLMVVSSAVETSAPTPVTVVEDVPMQVDESMETFEVDEATIAKETQLVVRRAKFIPLRLTEDERVLFNLLDASLNVSEYTDKVDILSYRSPVKRILTELSDLFNIMSGMMVASDFRNGKKKIAGQKYKDNSDFFKAVFEIGRRYKIMNPERMRNNYGKMIYLLQDASMQEIEDHFEFSCIEPTHTVHSFLESRNALVLLEDSDLPMATRSLADSCSAAQRAAKSQAITSLISRHTTANLSADDIRLVLNSIDDNNSYLALNCNPITRMQEYLEKYFQSPAPFSLEIRAGKNGARLSHSHKTQYAYAMQSLSLWKNMTLEMFKLWFAVEEDLIHGGGYRLRDTGQGLNRMQRAPQTSHLAHAILAHTQKTSPMAWVGSSAIHLGDHNVPNALMFIDKYTQVSRILSPIVQTCEFVSRMADDAYIKAMGGAEFVRQSILADFFKHGFDGSGADNFFDAGSCIDGRLTSAWNWCSKIEKKPFYHVFLMAGFVGFDGSFEKRVIDRGKPVQLHPLDASDRLSQRLDTNQDHEFLALVEVVQGHLKDENAIDAADALAAAVNHAEQRHYSKAVLRKQHVEMLKQLQSELHALERNLDRTKRVHLLEANKCLAAVAGELIAHEPMQGKEWNKYLDDAAVAYKKAGDSRFECIPAIAHKAEGDCLFGQAIAILGSSTDVDNAWTLMKEAAAAYEKYATSPHFEQCKVMLSVAAKDVAWSHKAHREVMESFESRRRQDISREVFVDTVKQRMLEAIDSAKQQSTNSDTTNALAQLERCKVFMKWLHHHAPDTLEASGVTTTSITALEKKFYKASIDLARSNLDAMVEYELGRTTASWIALARQDVDMALVLVASGALRQLATVILNHKFTNLFAQLLDLGDLLLGGIASDATMLATLTLEWLKVLVEILSFESSSSGAALRRIVQLTSTKIQLHHVLAKSSFVATALALRERSFNNVELMQELLMTVLHCGMIHAKCFDNDIRLVQLTCAIFSRYATIPEVAGLAFSIVLIAFRNGVPANKAAEFQLVAALAQALPKLTKKLPVVELAKSLAEQDKRVLGQCRQHRHAFLSVVPLSDPSWTSFIDDLTGGDTR